MTKLLQCLRDELVRRDYAGSTIRSYIQIVDAFRQHTGARLDRITPAHLRRYHLFLLEERFAGDLERAGWEMLLLNAAFRRELALVRILIASHHGRENGYCEDVFSHCRHVLTTRCDGHIRIGQPLGFRYWTSASGA